MWEENTEKRKNNDEVREAVDDRGSTVRVTI